MSLIKVVPYVIGMTPGVPGAPEPRMYPRSGYFLVFYIFVSTIIILSFFQGVGKSMTIRTVANHAENILREPGDDIKKPRVLLCAFTAKASNLISKCLLHLMYSFLSYMYFRMYL